MNRASVLFFGALATVLFSLAGMVFVPNWQMREMAPLTLADREGREVHYPEPLDPHLSGPGKAAYIAQGCIYCHSQQVRPASAGGDLERGWGQRRSVPRDYLFEAPPLLGTMRTGPDLANIAARQPDATWHHLHLFDARIVSEGSIMPPYRYLYTVVEQAPSKIGYPLPKAYLGYDAWIVPSPQALKLVAYLQALEQRFSLEQVQ